MLYIVEIRTVCADKCVVIIYLLLSVSYNARLVLGELVGRPRRRVRQVAGACKQRQGRAGGCPTCVHCCRLWADALITLTCRVDSTLPLG